MERILHVIDTLGVGGAERLLLSNIIHLPEFKHQVVTLFPRKDNMVLPDDVPHICLGAQRLTDLPFKRKQFQNIVKEYDPDFIHAHLYFSTIFSKWLTPPVIPYVFTQHSEFSKNAGRWYYRLADKLVSTNKHHCIAVSRSVLKDYLNSTAFKGDTRVIGNYVHDKYFEVRNKYDFVDRNELKLVAVGNLKPVKNHRYILEAFLHLKDLQVSCDVYGQGALFEELERQAVEYEVNVHFKGQIEDSSRVLMNYDAYLMPSLSEGFPLALFEAMATGLPVIVSDIPVFREVLQNDGHYISLSQPRQLRSVVEYYMSLPHLIKEDGARMRELARQKASKQKYFESLKGVYSELLKEKSTMSFSRS